MKKYVLTSLISLLPLTSYGAELFEACEASKTSCVEYFENIELNELSDEELFNSFLALDYYSDENDTQVSELISALKALETQRNDDRLLALETEKEEALAKAKNAGYTSGKKDGNAEGYASGKKDGNAEGYASGHYEGYASGNSTGYALGNKTGNAEGYASGKKDGNAEGRALIPGAVLEGKKQLAQALLSGISPKISAKELTGILADLGIKQTTENAKNMRTFLDSYFISNFKTILAAVFPEFELKK